MDLDDEGGRCFLRGEGHGQVPVQRETVTCRERDRPHRGEGVIAQARFMVEDEFTGLIRPPVKIEPDRADVRFVIDDPERILPVPSDDINIPVGRFRQHVKILLEIRIEHLPCVPLPKKGDRLHRSVVGMEHHLVDVVHGVASDRRRPPGFDIDGDEPAGGGVPGIDQVNASPVS